MKHKITSIFIFFFMGLFLLVSFLYIGDSYYFQSEYKTIFTLSKTPKLTKYIYWPCDIKGEELNYKDISSNEDIYYIASLKGSYATGGIVYIFFIGSVYSLLMVLFSIFEKSLKLYKKRSFFKYTILILFTVFFVYGFSYYLHEGDVRFSSGTEVSFMRFTQPVLLKNYIYECNHEENNHNNFLEIYMHQVGSGEGDGVGNQFVFNIIVIFSIYFILLWFYIIKNLILKNKN